MRAGADEEAVLLLPPEYQLLDPDRNLAKISRLLQIANLRNSRIQALTFAIKSEDKARVCLRLPLVCSCGSARPVASQSMAHVCKAAMQPESARPACARRPRSVQ